MAAPVHVPSHMLFLGQDIDASPLTGVVSFPSLRTSVELENCLDQQNVVGMMLHALQGWVITDNMPSTGSLTLRTWPPHCEEARVPRKRPCREELKTAVDSQSQLQDTRVNEPLDDCRGRTSSLLAETQGTGSRDKPSSLSCPKFLNSRGHER